MELAQQPSESDPASRSEADLGSPTSAGTVGTDTWTKESPPTQTTAPACLLTLAKPGEIRIVTGVWRATGITRWSFGRPVPTSKPFFANVRLLSDGRVTKIYRH
jgi:hypothetical protein